MQLKRDGFLLLVLSAQASISFWLSDTWQQVEHTGHRSLVTRSKNKLQIQKLVFIELDDVGIPAVTLFYFQLPQTG